MSISAKDYRNSGSEHDMQAALLMHLTLFARRDSWCIAIPNAGQRTPHAARRLKVEGMTAGVPDLCILIPDGKVIWIELKTGKGRQGPAQKNFQKFCEQTGHTYLMPRSLDEAIGMLTKIGILT
jgi:hypothetical protein